MQYRLFPPDLYYCAEWYKFKKSRWYQLGSVLPIEELASLLLAESRLGRTPYFDNAGKYFRIQNTNLTGKRCYLDLMEKIPNNKIVNGKIMGNSQAEYNQLTHFLF